MGPVGDLLPFPRHSAAASAFTAANENEECWSSQKAKKILLWIRATALTQLLKVSVLRRMLLKKGPLEIMVCEKSITFLESSEILSTEAEHGFGKQLYRKVI